MFLTLVNLSIAFTIARWGLLIAAGIVLYRRLAPPSLPWLAAHYAIAIPTASLLAKSFNRMVSESRSLHAFPDAPAYWGGAVALLSGVISFLIVVLVLAEIAHFLSKHYPNIDSRLLSRISAAHRHVTPLGITLVALTLVFPVTIFILWLSHHPATAA